MILENIVSLIEQYEDYNPSFYQRHKKKILAAGALGTLGALGAAGYTGHFGSDVQKRVADVAFKASSKLASKGEELVKSDKPENVQKIGRQLRNLGIKGMGSAVKRSLQSELSKLSIGQKLKDTTSDLSDKSKGAVSQGLNNLLSSKK